MGKRKAGNYESLALPEKNEYGVVISHNHLLAKRKEITAQDLTDYPLIISRRSSNSDDFRDFWRSSNILNTVLTFNLNYNAQYLLKYGNYCLFTYKDLTNLEDGNLIYRPIKPTVYDNNRVIWRKDIELSNVAQLFLKRLKENLEMEK